MKGQTVPTTATLIIMGILILMVLLKALNQFIDVEGQTPTLPF